MAGGTADENVNCMLYDPVTHHIIVAGNTVSNDFGPATTKHGFVYAMNLEGNWVWGNYYYNSTAIKDFTGCSMSSDGTKVVLQGESYK